MYKMYVDASAKRREETYADEKFQVYKRAAYQRILDANSAGYTHVTIPTFTAGEDCLSAYTEALCGLLSEKGYRVDGPGRSGGCVTNFGRNFFGVSWEDTGISAPRSGAP